MCGSAAASFSYPNESFRRLANLPRDIKCGLSGADKRKTKKRKATALSVARNNRQPDCSPFSKNSVIAAATSSEKLISYIAAQNAYDRNR